MLYLYQKLVLDADLCILYTQKVFEPECETGWSFVLPKLTMNFGCLLQETCFLI